MHRLVLSFTVISLTIVLLLPSADVLGQDQPKPATTNQPPEVVPSSERPAVARPTDRSPVDAAAAPSVGDKGDQPLREQTIYIPYSKLRETFERQGRGVFLPYEQFQQLWQKAREADRPQPDQRPPLGAVVSEIESQAAIERDVVVVRARLMLDTLGDGWHEIPLRLADAAIRSAKLDGEPARIVFDPRVGYKLLLRHSGSAAKRYELALEYAKAFSKSPGLNRVEFAAPQAAINRWRVRVPQRGVKISVHPMVATTEVPPGAPESATAEESVVLAFVGAAPEVRIEWTPKAEGATGLEALATVQAQQEAILDEGVLRTRVRLAYEISRAELARLTIDIPADQKVTSVFDANVRQWEVQTQGDRQTLTIQLFEPARASQNVTIELERYSDQLLASDVVVPNVRAVAVGRQQGVVVVRVGEELRAEPARQEGLIQLDMAELPTALQGSSWTFAYRYASLPFDLSLRVEKVKPRIRTEELVEVFLEPEQVTTDMLVLFDIQQSGVFQLEFDLPAGYVLRQVRGQEAAGAAAASVDSHLLEGEGKTRLKVNLNRRALGRVGLLLELYRRLDDPNLASPTGQSSPFVWPLPRTAMNVEATSGRLALFAPESLRITPDRQTGVRSVSFGEAIRGMVSQRQDRFPLLREALAFVYTLDPVDLSLTVERRKPQVVVRQLLTARIEAGVVKYEASFFYEVRYSSVKSLRIDLPTELTADVRNVSLGIREKTIEPRPEDVADGDTSWSFTGEREFLGSSMIRLTWERKSQELEVGKSIDYDLPVLKPKAVDLAWGQIVIAKAETLDVAAKPGFVGVRPIDPQLDLMEGARIADAARAFEFHDDWSLSITATRYELEDVKRTSVERAVLRIVVTRSGQQSVQALYRVRSAVQRLLVQLPEKRQFDTDPLRINGRPVPLERGDQNEVYVPLVSLVPDQAFVLELRYTVPGDHQSMSFPAFPAQPPTQSEPAVQKVYLLTYLPEELTLLGSRGPWSSEAANWLEHWQRPNSRPEPRALIDWVTEGIVLPNHPFDTFATDGRWHAFTTLHPAAPPAGALNLVAWNRRWINLTLFGGLVVFGLGVLRQRPALQYAALGVLITLIVLAGVFLPTFALNVLDGRFLAAAGLVALLWLISSAIQSRRSSATAHRAASSDNDTVLPHPRPGSTADMGIEPAKTGSSAKSEGGMPTEASESPFAGEQGAAEAAESSQDAPFGSPEWAGDQGIPGDKPPGDEGQANDGSPSGGPRHG